MLGLRSDKTFFAFSGSGLRRVGPDPTELENVLFVLWIRKSAEGLTCLYRYPEAC